MLPSNRVLHYDKEDINFSNVELVEKYLEKNVDFVSQIFFTKWKYYFSYFIQSPH